MANVLYTDASLDTEATYIDDAVGNPLKSSDLPHWEAQYIGDLTYAIKDGTDPGVANVTLKVSHLVPEWTASMAVTTGDEVRSTSHNGFVYKALNDGNETGTEPTWPTTIGATVLGGGSPQVTWQCERRTVEPESVKLALTSGGLAAATGGADLDLGVVSIPAGAINAIEYWIEVDNVAALTTGAECYVDAEHLVFEEA